MKNLLILAFISISFIANAKIIYKDISPDKIEKAGAANTGTLGFKMDIDGDGKEEFTLQNYYDPGMVETIYLATWLNGTDILGNSKKQIDVLNAGEVVGKKGIYIGLSATSFPLIHDEKYKDWIGKSNKYVGFKFLINSKVHYGWIELSVNSKKDVIIYGFAYEDVANKAIKAGEKNSSSTSVLDIESKQISVYPVPVQDVVIIEGDNVSSVLLMDISGRAIKIFRDNKTLNLSGYSSGVYYLKIKNREGENFIRKIVIE